MIPLNLFGSKFIYAEGSKIEQQFPNGVEAILEDPKFKEAIKPFSVDFKIKTEEEDGKCLYISFNRLGSYLSYPIADQIFYSEGLKSDMKFYRNLTNIQYKKIDDNTLELKLSDANGEDTFLLKKRPLSKEEQEMQPLLIQIGDLKNQIEAVSQQIEPIKMKIISSLMQEFPDIVKNKNWEGKEYPKGQVNIWDYHGHENIYELRGNKFYKLDFGKETGTVYDLA